MVSVVRFSYDSPAQNFMEMCPVGATMTDADRRDEANTRFSQQCERASKGKMLSNRAPCLEVLMFHFNSLLSVLRTY